MREILFKAKCKDRKELPKNQWWVEGYYAELGIGKNKKYYIIQNGALPQLFKNPDQNMYFIDVDVDPSTLCQYIGLTDKNGKKIWENDIVRTNRGRLCIVVFFSSPSHQGFDLKPIEVKNPPPKSWELWMNLEVVGNVFDNPELLEQEENAE